MHALSLDLDQGQLEYQELICAWHVSTDRNERWLRGGVHVSTPLSTSTRELWKEALFWLTLLLSLRCHPLIMSGFLLTSSLSVYTHGSDGREDTVPGETKLSHSSPRSPPCPRGHSNSHLPAPFSDPQSGDRR